MIYPIRRLLKFVGPNSYSLSVVKAPYVCRRHTLILMQLWGRQVFQLRALSCCAHGVPERLSDLLREAPLDLLLDPLLT